MSLAEISIPQSVTVSKPPKMHSCYILYNEFDQCYNGYTVDFVKRIRQHNCEIKGGARYTSNKGPWKYLMTIESEEFDNHKALQIEWSIRYPTNKRPRPKMYNSPAGRVASMPHVLANPKFAGIPMRIRIIPEFLSTLKTLCAGFSNVEVSELKPEHTVKMCK